jgi:hypothetical protein
VSGTLQAHITPSAAPTLEGHLTQLALTVTGAVPVTRPPGMAPPPVHTIELHAVSDVRMTARAGGTIRLEPARFAGNAGSVELWGESDAGRAQAGVRGRLTLGAVAPLVLPWLSHLSGDLDFDIAARATAAVDVPAMIEGTVRVATPVAFRVAGLPFEARLSQGEVRLDSNGVAHLDLPLALGAGVLRLAGTVTEPAFTGAERRIELGLTGDLDAHLLALAAPQLIATARGTARLDARGDGPAARPVIRARVRPGDIAVTLRALPTLPIEISGGQILANDQRASISDLRVSVGLGARAGVNATVGAAADGAAMLSYGSLLDPRPARIVVPMRGRLSAVPMAPAVIDAGGFALRADGDLTQRTRVSGEIVIEKAHVKVKGGAAPKTAAASSTSAARPELQRIDLDVTARSHGGAVTVEIPGPDAHVDVDYHVTGTAAKPKVAGKFEGADLYSSFLLLLRRIFQ